MPLSLTTTSKSSSSSQQRSRMRRGRNRTAYFGSEYRDSSLELLLNKKAAKVGYHIGLLGSPLRPCSKYSCSSTVTASTSWVPFSETLLWSSPSVVQNGVGQRNAWWRMGACHMPLSWARRVSSLMRTGDEALGRVSCGRRYVDDGKAKMLVLDADRSGVTGYK
ncbi:hypothetical protein HPP92_008488 [Vanilla planifolia]|uniref:Uncharacterized protein n=1 Tax=Vanilla planifolia TaxID=51239 RepID=A0A835RHE6_VANPL|nr:hypothetical protein HPP92_008488 [Vanilla planifolia]